MMISLHSDRNMKDMTRGTYYKGSQGPQVRAQRHPAKGQSLNKVKQLFNPKTRMSVLTKGNVTNRLKLN